MLICQKGYSCQINITYFTERHSLYVLNVGDLATLYFCARYAKFSADSPTSLLRVSYV
jgi:hypothetical protein